MIKGIYFGLVCAFISAVVAAQVPVPVQLSRQQGWFTLKKETGITIVGTHDSLNSTILFFNTCLEKYTGFTLAAGKGSVHNIFIRKNHASDSIPGNEGYRLEVKTTGILLTANTSAGIFYGLQTLLQLVSNNNVAGAFKVPCCVITDRPRFAWRGLMLDVSRHFFTKKEVERYIDEMVQYKFNVLHLHLSDDEGWRIEIKSLLQLTKVGAWRVQRTGNWGSFEPPGWREPATYGGYYTQEDIREMVQYAKERFVTIVPEIDVPAHSLALIASYPNLSCTGQPYPVEPGTDFYGKLDNALCVGNDSVFTILDKVFTEIAALFPGEYIHIGGDEANKAFWNLCPKCQKKMQDEHLKNADELQSYFVKRIATIIESKGKKVIGWDEILDGNLAPDIAVMAWRGMDGGTAAAKMHHPVVMSPWGNCYLDLYQGDTSVEPTTYGMSRLSDCYKYDPVPNGVDSAFILGGQGNLWTESVPNFRHAEYMTWPRAMALSEVYWSPKNRRNWDDFISRMEKLFPKLDAQHIKYARSCYNAIVTPAKDPAGNRYIQLSTEIKGLDMYYSFDNTSPDNFYPKYEGTPLAFPKGATELKVVTYRDGILVGKEITYSKTMLESTK